MPLSSGDPAGPAGEPRGTAWAAPSAPSPRGISLDIASQGEKKSRGVCRERLPSNRRAGLSGGRRGFWPLFARLSGGTKEFLPRSWTRCRAAFPGGARLAPQPGGFKQKAWSAGSLVGFYFISFFSFQKTTPTPFCENISPPPPPSRRSPRPPCAPPAPPCLRLARVQDGGILFSPSLFYYYLFIYFILLYFHCTFRLQLPELFDLPRCLLTRKKTPALSAGSSAHTWAPWRSSMLLPNLVTQRARGGTGGGMKGAAGGTSKAPPPRPAPALPYKGGAGGGRRFARQSVRCPPPSSLRPEGSSVAPRFPSLPRGSPP